MLFFTAVNLSHSAPGGRLARLQKAKLREVKRLVQNHIRWCEVSLNHTHPSSSVPQVLGEGQMFFEERGAGRTPRAVGGQP